MKLVFIPINLKELFLSHGLEFSCCPLPHTNTLENCHL